MRERVRSPPGSSGRPPNLAHAFVVASLGPSLTVGEDSLVAVVVAIVAGDPKRDMLRLLESEAMLLSIKEQAQSP